MNIDYSKLSDDAINLRVATLEGHPGVLIDPYDGGTRVTLNFIHDPALWWPIAEREQFGLAWYLSESRGPVLEVYHRDGDPMLAEHGKPGRAVCIARLMLEEEKDD